MIILSDKVKIRTELKLFITTTDRRVIREINLGRNVITNQGRANMAHLVAGDDVANRCISSLQIGDAGHDTGNPTQAIPPSPTDISLFGNLVIEKSVSYEFPDGSEANRVTFTVEIETGEANGSGSQAISEVGLFDLTGRMMTHKTFGLITKTDAFGMIFRYSILV